MDKKDFLSPYFFKRDYNWEPLYDYFDKKNKVAPLSGASQTMDYKDLQFSLSDVDFMDDKYRELYEIIGEYE